MEFDYRPNAGGRRMVGFGFVVLLHILIIWGLVSGLARKAVEIVKKPIDVKIIEEIKPPPPPPPPPPKQVKMVERVQAPVPPPPFVPPPEVQPPPTAAPAITSVQEPPKEPVKIEPPPPPAPPAPPAKVTAQVACPGYVSILQATMGPLVSKEGQNSEMLVRFTVNGTSVTDVQVVSGASVYRRPLAGAVRRFTCSYNGEVTVDLPVSLKVDN